MASPEGDVLDEPGPSASPRQREAAGSKLFLGGLSWATTEEDLQAHFGKWGDIVEAVVMRDRQTSRPRGFGFVTFEKAEVADRVVQDAPHVIDGRQIDAKKSVPQEQKPKARKIFVGGLAPDTTEEDVKEYFSLYGEVVETQIMQDHMSGRSRGFGFVTFAEDSSAEAVFAAGPMHDLGGKRVEVKPATPKGSGSMASRPGGRGGGARPAPFPARGPPGGSPYGQLPGAPPYGYGMYGYGPAAGMLPSAPYGMPYPQQYMMMQQLGGYPSPGFAFQPGHFGSGPGRGPPGAGGLLGAPPPVAVRQQPPPPLPHLHGPLSQARSRNGSRGKVDSASSLDQHTSEHFAKLGLE